MSIKISDLRYKCMNLQDQLSDYFNQSSLDRNIARSKRRRSPKLDELQLKHTKYEVIRDVINKMINDLEARGALSPGSELLPEFERLDKEYQSVVSLRCKTYREIKKETMHLENRAQLIEGGMQFVQEFFETAIEVPVDTINFVRGIVNILA